MPGPDAEGRPAGAAVADGRRCPVCGAGGGALVRALPGYDVLECAACSVQYADPMRAAGAGWYAGEGDYSSALGPAAAGTLRHVYGDRLDRDARAADWLGPNHLAFLAELPNRGGRLLDVGCGEGTFLRFAGRHYDVRGIDLDERSVARAAETLGDRVARLTLEELAGSEPEQAFDVATMFEVLEHVEDPIGALATVHRLLRPGGRLVLSVPNRLRPGGDDDPVDWPPNHLTRWTDAAVRRALGRTGFRVVRCHATKASRYGYWEAGWLLGSRFPRLFETLGAWGDGAALAARRASGIAWVPLWPAYALLRRSSYGIYAGALAE
jgi:SAM-dependent methyltransferase